MGALRDWSDRAGRPRVIEIGITLDTYSHAVPAMHEGAAAKIAALIE